MFTYYIACLHIISHVYKILHVYILYCMYRYYIACLHIILHVYILYRMFTSYCMFTYYIACIHIILHVYIFDRSTKKCFLLYHISFTISYHGILYAVLPSIANFE